MGFFDSVASVLTGGISDVIQGDAPFSALGEDVSKYVAPFVSPLAYSTHVIVKGIENDDWGKVINYIVDPITEPGIDTVARTLGDETERVIPGFKETVNKINAPVAGLMSVAGVPPWITLSAYEVANKMAGGSAEQGLMGGAAIGASALANAYTPYTSTDYSSLGASPAYGGEVAKNSYLINGGTNATDNLAQGITNNTLMAGTDATANLAQGGYTQPLVYGTSQAPAVALNEGLMKPVNENYWSDKVKALAEKKAKDLVKNQAKKYINEALGAGQAIQPITLSQVQMQSYKPQLNSFQGAQNIQSQQEQALQKEATKTSDTQKAIEAQELERQGYLKKYLDYMYNKSGGRTQLLRDYIA